MKRSISLFLIICMLAALCGCGTGDMEYIPTGDGMIYGDDYTGPTHAPSTEENNDTISLPN